MVKRLSFEGIYGLLHKNELNEKGKGLKSKEMRPIFVTIYPPLGPNGSKLWLICYGGSYIIILWIF